MLPRITCLLSTLFLIPLLTAHGAADTAARSVSFPVRTHGVQLTKTELQEVLNIAQDKLAHRGVNISLEPDSDSFSGDNVIDKGPIIFETGDVDGCKTIENFLKNNPGVVHIVSEIPCCGGVKQGVVGCSGLNLAMLVLPPHQQEDVQLRAVEWMHELGHNKGLCHSQCSTNALMTPNPLGVKDTELDSCEQSVFTGGKLSDLACTQAQNCRQMNCDDAPESTLERQVTK